MGAMVAVWIFRRAADEATRATEEDNRRFRKAILAGTADFALEFLSVASSVQANVEASFDGTFLVNQNATLFKPTVLIVALDNLARLPLESATTILRVDQALRRVMTHNVMPAPPSAVGKAIIHSDTLTSLRYSYSNLSFYLSAAIRTLDVDTTYPRTKEQAKSYAGALGYDDRYLLSDLDILMKINVPRREEITDMRPIETVVGRDEG